MLTFGGHKGSALAAMVELAGPLIGDATSKESLAYDDGTGSSPYGGELIIALDPERFLGADRAKYFASAEAMFADMQAQGARIPANAVIGSGGRANETAWRSPRRCTTKSWRCAISAGLIPRAGNPARASFILPERVAVQALAPYRFGIPAGEVFRLFTRLHLMPHVFLPPDRFLSSQRWASLFNRPLQNARFLSGNGRRLSGGVQRPVPNGAIT